MPLPANIQAAIDRKPVYARTDDYRKSAHPEPERSVRDEPLGAIQAQEKDSGGDYRIQVTVTSYRCRLLDEDNLCPKYHIDALRYAGLLPTDAPEYVSITTRQVKVDGKEKERTEITIVTFPRSKL